MNQATCGNVIETHEHAGLLDAVPHNCKMIDVGCAGVRIRCEWRSHKDSDINLSEVWRQILRGAMRRRFSGYC
jgi:hypothetical protein